MEDEDGGGDIHDGGVGEVSQEDVDVEIDAKREDSPEYFPSLRKEFSSHAKKRKANFKQPAEASTSKPVKSATGVIFYSLCLYNP